MRRKFFSKQGKDFQQNNLLSRDKIICLPHETLLAADVAHIVISAPNYNATLLRS
jgi:hypothetical protein